MEMLQRNPLYNYRILIKTFRKEMYRMAYVCVKRKGQKNIYIYIYIYICIEQYAYKTSRIWVWW
jgi:hypothetical protein